MGLDLRKHDGDLGILGLFLFLGQLQVPFDVEEEEEDEFNSNGFMNNSSYSGDKYRDVKRGVIR